MFRSKDRPMTRRLTTIGGLLAIAALDAATLEAGEP